MIEASRQAIDSSSPSRSERTNRMATLRTPLFVQRMREEFQRSRAD